MFWALDWGRLARGLIRAGFFFGNEEARRLRLVGGEIEVFLVVLSAGMGWGLGESCDDMRVCVIWDGIELC